MPVVEVNPFRCRVWHLHERMEEYVSEKTCEAEIRSFEERGQLIPAIGRRIVGDADHDMEIICGLRRLFVARHLNVPLAVDVREMSDREGFIAMDIENRQRKEVSPYERGHSYARWLRSGNFQSQEDLARALRMSPSQISRLLRLARLPSVIISAFGSGADIREGWAAELSDALEDTSKRAALIKVARDIAASHPRPQPQDIYRQLLQSSVSGRRPRASSHDQVVKSEDGVALFRVRRHVDSVVLILPIEALSARLLQRIEDAVAHLLKDSAAHPRTGEARVDHPPRPLMSVVQGGAASSAPT